MGQRERQRHKCKKKAFAPPPLQPQWLEGGVSPGGRSGMGEAQGPPPMLCWNWTTTMIAHRAWRVTDIMTEICKGRHADGLLLAP